MIIIVRIRFSFAIIGLKTGKNGENQLKNSKKLPKGSYVTDAAFSPRQGAAGGGWLLTKGAMEAMLEIGLELYLSEYPPFEDE